MHLTEIAPLIAIGLLTACAAPPEATPTIPVLRTAAPLPSDPASAQKYLHLEPAAVSIRADFYRQHPAFELHPPDNSPLYFDAPPGTCLVFAARDNAQVVFITRGYVDSRLSRTNNQLQTNIVYDTSRVRSMADLLVTTAAACYGQGTPVAATVIDPDTPPPSSDDLNVFPQTPTPYPPIKAP